MPRTESDVRHKARLDLVSRGFQDIKLTNEGSKLPSIIREKFTSKSGSGRGYPDIAGDFRNTHGFVLVVETKSPGEIDKAIKDLQHYLQDLKGFTDVVGWATDGDKEHWVIQTIEGVQKIL